MKRSLRIFALLIAASMVYWMLGCGDDEEDAPELKINSVSISEGDEVAGNQSIVVTASNTLESADLTVDGATGTTTIAGKKATWTPDASGIPIGAHTFSGSVTDEHDQSVDVDSVGFTALVKDEDAPSIVDSQCVPPNGATDIEGASVANIVVVFDEAMKDPVGAVVSEPADIKVTPSLSADGLTLTLEFLGQVSIGPEERITIELTGTDLAGNALTANTYTFATKAKDPQ
jgi:hypothetical protein